MLLQKLLFALYFAAVIHCQCLKNPSKIIKAMNGEDAQLRLVFAHRGIQTRIAVENSIRAVDEACKTDVDGIEIDVQIAKDGTLWPSHDTRVGRITSYKDKPTDTLFDILKDDPYGPKNPRIRDLTHDQLDSLFLRNTRGEVQQGVYFHSVEFVLTQVKTNYPHVAIVLDVKSADAVTPAAELVNRLGMQGQVVIKFLAVWVPPSAVASATRGVGFIVVTYCDMLDGFVDKGIGPNPQEKVKSYLSAYFNNPNYVSMEPPTKNWFVSNNKEVVLPTGPGGFVDRWLVNEVKRGIGKFHLRNDYNLGTVDSLGHCCVDANSYLATSRVFGKEGPDQRYDANVVLKAADWVTTDSATEVLADAVRSGFRVKRDTLC
ncbi:PLC-like phosphodiesterase [Phyllosticta citribraziliensis]|uniref:PLC-like phosphodiesterase n=1 Tax=Phyllosticta citribraziliensis TaxID=989973 RepID=A0ABR1LQ93_9PEZI